MIPEIGQYGLVLALMFALVQSTLPLIGAARGDYVWMNLAKTAAYGQLLFVTVAFLALTWSYIVSDFSVLNVVQNSHTTKPMLYKISGVWGNHEGSMVVWVLILALFGAAIALFGRGLPDTLRARTLAIQGLIGVGFLLFILFTSNPFERLAVPPADGQSLNPLLQDPGLAFHPPFLYLGYVGFSTAFSFAVAALIEGHVTSAWARWVRPWTLAAWISLTIGIAMGSWWAYYELGWGGWWFWDPVENASFMPWLAGTALLHSAIVVEKRDALKSWTVLLAILTFSLSLMGTFIVRSGILTSVHSFATDPARGFFILILLIIATGGSLILFAIRAPVLRSKSTFDPISREGALVLNNLLLATACATVFLGTLYPLILDALTGDKISVGPPFFNATFVPLMTPVLLAVAIGPLLAWKRGDLKRAMSQLWVALTTALTIAVVTMLIRGVDGKSLLAAFALGLSAWLIMGALLEFAERIKLFRTGLAASMSRAMGLPRAAWGMTIAHAGLGIAVAGIATSTAWQVESVQAMRIGDSVNVAGYNFRLDSVEGHMGPNYQANRGTFTVTKNGAFVATLYPEKRIYPVGGRDTTEAAIHTTWISDLYAVVTDPTEGSNGQSWSTRIYHNPLVPWIWAGAVMMALGGVVSLSDRRHRVGAPRREAKSMGAVPATA